MTLIDGVGDEVTVIGVSLVLLTFLLLAWLSTSVTEYSWLQTVLTAAAYLNAEEATDQLLVEDTPQQTHQPAPNILTEPIENPGPSTGTAPEEPEPICRKRKLPQCGIINSNNPPDHNPPVNVEVVDGGNATTGNIQVRLKFLNDTLRHVDAHLDEELGAFKRRHFAEELNSNKIVRLIFNGHLLQRDQETLQHHGLFDNCVVHCQISATNNRAPTTVQIPVELDLSRFMFPMFGILLGMLWCCRIQYRQYFNTTSTFALVCITGLFVMSVATLCLPARHRAR